MAQHIPPIAPEQLQALTKAAYANLQTVMNQLESADHARFDLTLDCLDQAKQELETIIGEGQ